MQGTTRSDRGPSKFLNTNFFCSQTVFCECRRDIPARSAYPICCSRLENSSKISAGFEGHTANLALLAPTPSRRKTLEVPQRKSVRTQKFEVCAPFSTLNRGLRHSQPPVLEPRYELLNCALEVPPIKGIAAKGRLL